MGRLIPTQLSTRLADAVSTGIANCNALKLGWTYLSSSDVFYFIFLYILFPLVISDRSSFETCPGQGGH